MNILTVAHAYPRWDGDPSGAFVERLVVAVRERGHTATVVSPADGERVGADELHGVPVTRVRYAPVRFETLAYRGTMADAARSPWGALAAANLVRAMTRQIRTAHRILPVDIVHAHWWVPGGISAALAARRLGLPYVVTLHGTDVRILQRSRAARWVARWVLRRAAAVTTVSSYLADGVAAWTGIHRHGIHVQPMPVQVHRFTRRSRGGDGLVYLGRLGVQKRLGLVLEALARLRGAGRPVRLAIIGDGPERAALEAHAARLELQDLVTFRGPVPPDGVPEAFGDADVMVFPAQQEGYGLAAAEALMLGIPVIAAEDGGGVTDIVPGAGAGRFVPPDDVAQWADAIGELLDAPEARAQAVDRGRVLREWLAPEHVAAVFEGVYRHAAAQ